ncbi:MULTISPECIES: YugN family protein [unclassified Lysinibacillus]|uniref:YugN family protein n=1 Tax=unclassified Lysinibacillus TaxID=2636778 RepID=UPI0036EDD70B
MLRVQSDIIGKYAHFGQLRERIEKHGFSIGGNWDYDKGSFDTTLHCNQEEGETIYLRMPFEVTEGELDGYNTVIRFQEPYVIKHVVHVGLDYDGSSLMDTTGFSQFQSPIDKDAPIIDKSKWVHMSEELVSQEVLPYIQAENIY